MAWPLSQDYNEAIQDPQTSFSDPELKGGEPTLNALGMPMPRSGNFADVYEFNTPQTKGKWAIKCFTRHVLGLRERYTEISAALLEAKLPFAVDFQYLVQGIRIKGDWFPILKMRWVEGLLLNELVKANLDKPAVLGQLGTIWTRMAKRLREAGIAHADLQHGNVILVPGSKAGSLAVKLIDYDGMFVPALATKKSGEVGHPNYQHPQRLREGTYTADVDRFPLLVVATALRALSVGGRELWERYDNGDNLLFKESDLKAPEQSALLKELHGMADPQTRMLAEALQTAIGRNLEDVPKIDELLPETKPTPAKAPEPVKVVEAAPVPEITPAVEPAVETPRRKAAQRTGIPPWLLLAGGGVVAVLLLAVVGGGLGLMYFFSGDRNKGDKHAQVKPGDKLPKDPKTPPVKPVVDPNKDKKPIVPVVDPGKTPPDAVDLLKNLNPAVQTVKGKWSLQGKDLVSGADEHCVLEFPHDVPEEYTLKLQVARTAGDDVLSIGLVVGDRRCMVVLDGGPNLGHLSGLEMIDGKYAGANETTRKGAVFKNGVPSEVVCTVKRSGILVTVDGKGVIDYKATWDNLSLGWTTPNNKALFLGTRSVYHISRLELTPSKSADPVVPGTDGFVPLFNGKNMDGWKRLPNPVGEWKVADGVVTFSGPPGASFATLRGDFKDFHLRVETRISDAGFANLLFRADIQPGAKKLFGWQARIKDDAKFVAADKTGTIVTESPKTNIAQAAKNIVCKPGQWITLEVIAQGNRVTTKVDGVETAQLVDSNNSFLTSGAIGVQLYEAGTVIEIRKVEIKELGGAAMPPEALNASIAISFQGALANKAINVLTSSNPSVRVATSTIGGNGVNAVQTLAFNGITTGTNFTLTYDDGITPVTTNNIAYDTNVTTLIANITNRLRPVFGAANFGVAPIPVADGFVQLFNGKDLTGWKPHPQWRVENGIVRATNANSIILETVRNDYRDFHVRADVRFIKNSGNPQDGGLVLRWSGNQGYQVMVNGPIGTLYVHRQTKDGSLRRLDSETQFPLDKWTKLEIIARKNHFVIKMNGNVVLDFVDAEDCSRRGYIGLSCVRQGVELRDIEIKELPPETVPPVVAGTPGFESIFNNKNLAGWNISLNTDADDWKVVDGMLVGAASNTNSTICTVREFKEMHLRVEMRYRPDTNANVYVWTQPNLPLKTQRHGFHAIINDRRDKKELTGAVGMFGATGGGTVGSGRPLPPDQWFVLEIIAEGDRVSIKLDGANVSATNDAAKRFPRSGAVGFNIVGKGGGLEIRKIEIKELKAEAAPVGAGKRFPATVPQPSKGAWRVEGEELVHGTDTIAELFFGDPKWTDYDFEVQAMRTKADEGFSLVCRRSGDDTLYYYRLGVFKGTVIAQGWLAAGSSSQTNTKDIKDKPLQANVWYLVKMSVRGDKGECYFDGVKIFDFKADKHAAGAVGLSPLGSRYRFKNIRVTAPDGTVLLEGMPDLAAGAAPAADGFVSLFNGKDLTGWLPATMGPVKWRVENDAIVGPGNSYLSSARSDYKNFHLRLEARCTAAADSSSVWVRVSPAQEGYEIWVNSLLKTAGDLYVRNKKSSIPKGSGAKVPPGQWFTMEVIAVGERITVKVNGKTTTDFTDVGSGLRSGRIAIRGLSGAPEVRKIEIKELPAP